MKSLQELIQTLKSKVREWKLMEYVSKAWNAISQLFSRIGNTLRLRARFKNTKAYAKLMAMTPLRRRMVVMLVSVFILLGLLIGFNTLKTVLFNYFISGMGLPPATVSTMVAEEDEWQPTLSSVGNIRAFRGVDLSAETGGAVLDVFVKSGMDVKKGDLLIQLNDASDIAQLNSYKAMADLARVINERDKQQLAIQAISKNVFDTSAADAKSKAAQVEQQAALVAKKSIKAPFSGRVGIIAINPGQYVNAGDKMLTVQTLDPIFVDFTLPQSTAGMIGVGQEIEMKTDAFKDAGFKGKITAVSPKVELNTRNMQIEAIVNNPDKKVLPGMFANVTINLGNRVKYLTLPQTAITYNPYGSTVFIARKTDRMDKQGKPLIEAEQVFVTTGLTRGDQVAIVKGLEPGVMVVTSGQLKLKNGTPLIINNRVQPGFNPNPKPQEQ
jgi:membrane fusion protein (multidrug efflux system)